VEGFEEISRETLTEKIAKRADNFTLIDVRQRRDYRRAHIPQALNIPLEDVELLVPRLVPNKYEDMVVYGGDQQSQASVRAAQLLAGLGYQHVKRYAGGISDWTNAGFAAESDEQTGDAAA
jgi:rhodanese-related sulfurtransferase